METQWAIWHQDPTVDKGAMIVIHYTDCQEFKKIKGSITKTHVFVVV